MQIKAFAGMPVSEFTDEDRIESFFDNEDARSGRGYWRGEDLEE